MLSFRSVSNLDDLCYFSYRLFILNQGFCYELIRDRIYGSLQLGSDVLIDGHHLSQHFASIENDEQSRQAYAVHLKNSLMDAFEQCDATDCILDKFCEQIISYVNFNNNNLSNELIKNCKHEQHRFQNFIWMGSTNYCKFNKKHSPWTTKCGELEEACEAPVTTTPVLTTTASYDMCDENIENEQFWISCQSTEEGKYVCVPNCDECPESQYCPEETTVVMTTVDMTTVDVTTIDATTMEATTHSMKIR